MPSVRVPLAGTPNWKIVQDQRREYWERNGHDTLTAHFSRPEFDCHDGAIVPIVARPALIALCKDYLEPMRTKFGSCNVLSGYRHELYNAQIGGARQSQHIYEMTFEAVASDVRFERGTPTDWAREAKVIRTRLAKGGGIGTYLRAGFVHIDNRRYEAEWSG